MNGSARNAALTRVISNRRTDSAFDGNLRDPRAIPRAGAYRRTFVPPRSNDRSAGRRSGGSIVCTPVYGRRVRLTRRGQLRILQRRLAGPLR